MYKDWPPSLRGNPPILPPSFPADERNQPLSRPFFPRLGQTLHDQDQPSLPVGAAGHLHLPLRRSSLSNRPLSSPLPAPLIPSAGVRLGRCRVAGCCSVRRGAEAATPARLGVREVLDPFFLASSEVLVCQEPSSNTEQSTEKAR